MRFISTRGEAPPLGFEDILLSGPAPDGGLYVPETWPHFSPAEFAALNGRPYAEIVVGVIAKFAERDWADRAARVARDVYPRFTSPEVAPLVALEPGRYLLELFHGPTLAFKDFALQLVVPLMAEALERRKEKALVLVATSGDTGAAAVAAIAGQPNIGLVALHPKGRISDVQRRQMTTEPAPNVHNVAVEGTFDDAQALVKALFADTAFAKAHHLAAVNSINWVRIAAQVAYYISSCLRLGMKPITFVVPSGNFGDVFAGFVAHKIGAPVARLVIATNSNDILARAIDTGIYARGQVHATQSPAMDIQVASNFERLIFEAHGRNGSTTRSLMAQFAKTGALEFSHDAHQYVRKLFAAASVDEHETSLMIARVHKATQRLVDPHTAVGLAAAERLTRPEETVVTLATAHPAKFPDAVEQATGVRPPLPAAMRHMLTASERYATLANDASTLKRFIAQI